MKAETKLNLEYSWAQGAYWASNGLIFNFAAVFLQHRGYSNYALGIILALGNIAAFPVQPAVADYIDKRNKKPLLKSSAIIMAVSMLLAVAAAFIPSACIALSAVYVLILASSILLQPLTNSMSAYLCSWGYDISFSRARAVGSLCFALCMAVMGALTRRLSPQTVPIAYALLVAVLLIPMLLLIRQDKTLRRIPPKVFDNPEKAAGSIGEFIRGNKRFCVYLLGVALLFFSHSLLGNFMIEFLKPLGGDSEDMGRIFCIMALCELPAMLLFGRLLKKLRCSALLKFSAVMFAAKSAAAWAAASVGMMYAAMCLQALSFALFIPASVRYVEEVILKRDSVKGQSFTTCMFTLGSIFASYLGGYMLDNISVSNTLMVGTLAATLGALIILPSVQKTKLNA